jgi:hypothetical protein
VRTLFRVVTVVALPGDVADTRRDNARRHRVAKGALPANEPAEAVAVAVAVALPRRTWLQRVARIVAEVVGRCHVAFADELVSAIVGAAATAEMWRMPRLLLHAVIASFNSMIIPAGSFNVWQRGLRRSTQPCERSKI